MHLQSKKQLCGSIVINKQNHFGTFYEKYTVYLDQKTNKLYIFLWALLSTYLCGLALQTLSHNCQQHPPWPPPPPPRTHAHVRPLSFTAVEDKQRPYSCPGVAVPRNTGTTTDAGRVLLDECVLLSAGTLTDARQLRRRIVSAYVNDTSALYVEQRRENQMRISRCNRYLHS